MHVTLNDIVVLMNELAPMHLAENWDNVGLMVGRKEHPIKSILLALDITPEVVEQAVTKKVDLIITHHPLIFQPLKSITDAQWQQKLILTLIENNIAVYSAHTNLDCVSGGVSDVLAKILKLDDYDLLDLDTGLGRVGVVEKTSLYDFAKFVKETLKCDYVSVGNAEKPVHKVAVCGGAGADLINIALQNGCDTLVRGDVKYHDAQRAVFSGLNIIDAGHQPTELPVLEGLADRLSLHFTERSWNIIVTVAEEKLLLKHF